MICTNSITVTAREKRKNPFREYYSHYFEKIEADSLSHSDDEGTGKFITTEYYSIHNFWELEKGVKKTWFAPYVINSVLKKPKEAKRTMPFTIAYPAKYQEEIIVNVPEDRNGNESMENITCSAFKLHTQYAYFYRKFKLKYEYESLKDHVLPNEADAFFTSYEKADENLEYSLSKETDDAAVKKTLT